MRNGLSISEPAVHGTTRYCPPVSVDVEVIIVSYNSGPVMGACLRSVYATIPAASVAIREHGTDGESLENLAEVLAPFGPRARIEHDPTNPGFGAGCNAMAASSTARWLVFLNPDAQVVTWPWIGTDPPARTIVGATMVDTPNGWTHHGTDYRIIDEIQRGWLRRSDPRPISRGFVSGAAMLVEREAFESIGGFDERYFLYYEDIELCLRANMAHIATTVSSGWTVRHEGAHSTRETFGDSLVWSYDSACRFHAGRGESLLLYRSYVVLDALARCLLRALRSDTVGRRSYARLVRRVGRDLVGHRGKS